MQSCDVRAKHFVLYYCSFHEPIVSKFSRKLDPVPFHHSFPHPVEGQFSLGVNSAPLRHAEL